MMYDFRTKEGQAVEPTERVHIDTTAKEAEASSALIIEPVTMDDSGTYTATAKNECGKVTTSSHVTIQSMQSSGH